MAATDYIITPMDIVHAVRWFGWRGAISLFVAVFVGVGISLYIGIELGVFVALFVFWTGAGYSGRLFFVAAIILLLMIMGISVYDTEFEIGDTKAIEKLAVWVFYFMAIGVVKLFVESMSDKELPHNKKTQNQPQPQPEKPNNRLAEMTIEEKPKPIQRQSNMAAVHKNLVKTKVRPHKRKTIDKKYIRPVHPAYTPTTQRRKVKLKGLIQG